MDTPRSREKKIYVSNIPKHVESKQLQRYFEAFGPVYSAVVIGAKKGKSLSYGFVSFSHRKTLERVLLHTHTLEGSQLQIDTVSISKSKENLIKYANGEDMHLFLFIQDIPKDVNKLALVQHFETFGILTIARLVSRPEKHKDFIYLQFKDVESTAVAKSQKHRIHGLSIENITLVCKVGIFRNPKQMEMMEEAEDLLVHYSHREYPDVSHIQQVKRMIYSKIDFQLGEHVADFQPSLCAPSDQSCEYNLDESEGNYRFNQGSSLKWQFYETPQISRTRATRHLNMEDIQAFSDSQAFALDSTDLGPIGSRVSPPAPAAKKPRLSAVTSALAQQISTIGKLFRNPFGQSKSKA